MSVIETAASILIYFVIVALVGMVVWMYWEG